MRTMPSSAGVEAGMEGRRAEGAGAVTEVEHVTTLASYEWILGTRWRWDCRCGRGAHGYVAREWAETHAEEHEERARVVAP